MPVRSTAAFKNCKSKNELWPTSTARVQPGRLELLADFLKQRAQRVAFVDRRPQRMKRIDARHLQRRRDRAASLRTA